MNRDELVDRVASAIAVFFNENDDPVDAAKAALSAIESAGYYLCQEKPETEAPPSSAAEPLPNYQGKNLIEAMKGIRDGVFHSEQLVIWADELTTDLSPYLSIESYDDGLDIQDQIKAFLTSSVRESVCEYLVVRAGHVEGLSEGRSKDVPDAASHEPSNK